jgi:hypothetical protein
VCTVLPLPYLVDVIYLFYFEDYSSVIITKWEFDFLRVWAGVPYPVPVTGS